MYSISKDVARKSEICLIFLVVNLFFGTVQTVNAFKKSYLQEECFHFFRKSRNHLMQ